MTRRWVSHPTAWRDIHGLLPCLPGGQLDLDTLRADLAAARAARDQLQRAHEASQREVTRLRLALAKGEKAAREGETL